MYVSVLVCECLSPSLFLSLRVSVHVYVSSCVYYNFCISNRECFEIRRCWIQFWFQLIEPSMQIILPGWFVFVNVCSFLLLFGKKKRNLFVYVFELWEKRHLVKIISSKMNAIETIFIFFESNSRMGITINAPFRTLGKSTFRWQKLCVRFPFEI